MNLAIWTGGPMNAADALDKLRSDGFPVEDIDVSETTLVEPRYSRAVGEGGDIAQARFERAMSNYMNERRAEVIRKAGEVALRLIAASATSRADNVEWRGEKGNERAAFELAAEYDRRFPSAGPPALVYVIGPWELLGDVAKQGVAHPGSQLPRETLPGVTPRAYVSFMSKMLALCPTVGVQYPVIVAHDAYAVGYYVSVIDEGRVSVGVMPRRERVGVVGATAEQVVKDMRVQLEAESRGEVAPNFDPNDFKARLRLRRKLAATGSDNQG